jgi:hypothetical protein
MTIETELPAVKVKALEWEVYPDDGTRMFEGQNEQRQYISRALPPIGPAIFIMTKDDVYSIEDREGIYGTENDAKMVAQADYELRILSALTLKDDTGNAERDLVKALKHAYAILLSEGYEEDSVALHPIRDALSQHRKGSESDG